MYTKIAKKILPYLEDLKKNQWHYTRVEESPETDDVKSWEWAVDQMISACKNPKKKSSKQGFELLGKYFQHLEI